MTMLHNYLIIEFDFDQFIYIKMQGQDNLLRDPRTPIEELDERITKRQRDEQG